MYVKINRNYGSIKTECLKLQIKSVNVGIMCLNKLLAGSLIRQTLSYDRLSILFFTHFLHFGSIKRGTILRFQLPEVTIIIRCFLFIEEIVEKELLN